MERLSRGGVGSGGKNHLFPVRFTKISHEDRRYKMHQLLSSVQSQFDSSIPPTSSKNGSP